MGLFRKKYVYDAEKYKDTFLSNVPYSSEYVTREVPRVVYCFWTGDNPITENRKEGLETMREKLGVEVVLVTPENLPEYVLPGHPLHPGYKFLSLNHRSDYLRCYFMHHYGGGYADIKRFRRPWKKAFDRLGKSDKWALGYSEVGPKGIARVGGVLEEGLEKNWRVLIGNGAFICRPGTPFTADWYAEVHRRMDGYMPGLEAHPGDMWGKNEGYPIPWTGMQGDIFHPFCLKYNEHIMQDDSIRPSFRNYK